MLKKKKSHFVSFAAILSTLSLFTSPITQQMITYSTRSTPGTTPGSPEARAELTYARNVHYTDTIPDWIRRSVLTTLGSRADSPVQPLEATCTTTKCTFPRYTTLSVCMKMADISSHLTVTKIPAGTAQVADWSMGEDWLPAVTEGVRTSFTTSDISSSLAAWNASLPNGMSLVTPLSYAYITWPFGGRMNDSIAFRDSPDDKFTALANFFHIYSAAGNVSYPGYDSSSGTEETPWKFYAYEILYHMCINTYETVYEAGVSTTTLINSTNIPFTGVLETDGKRLENLETYNAACYFPTAQGLNKPGVDLNAQGDGHSNPNTTTTSSNTNNGTAPANTSSSTGDNDVCPHLEKPGTFTALQDPFDSTGTKSYIMDRYLGATITAELFFKARNSYVGDGVPTHRGVSSGAGADAVKEALWGPAQMGNFSAAETEERLKSFMEGFAVSLGNG